jgi:hypothetical protein
MEITKHEAGKYRVVLATSASIGPVVSEIRKSKCSQAANPTFDTTIRIWIPASVLARTFPEMVAAFHKKKNSAAILRERLPRVCNFTNKITFLTGTAAVARSGSGLRKFANYRFVGRHRRR